MGLGLMVTDRVKTSDSTERWTNILLFLLFSWEPYLSATSVSALAELIQCGNQKKTSKEFL